MANQTIHPALSEFDALPDSAFVDALTLAQLFSCSLNTVWRRSRAGVFPQPVKISPQQTRWRVGDVRKVLAGLGS